MALASFWVVALAFLPSSFLAFGFVSDSPSCQRRGRLLASLQGNSNGNLSSLIGDMLQSKREQAKAEQELQDVLAKNDAATSNLPPVDAHGVYRITNEEQLLSLQAAHPHEALILKFSAPWCHACRRLAYQFAPFVKRYTAQSQAGVVFADLSCCNSNMSENCDKLGCDCDLLGVFQLPSLRLYAAGGQELETFACGPQHYSWPQLKSKITSFLSNDGSASSTSAGGNEPMSSSSSTALHQTSRPEEIIRSNGNSKDMWSKITKIFVRRQRN